MRSFMAAGAVSLAMCVGLAATGLAQEVENSAISPDQVVATINGDTITMADLQAIYEELPQQYRQMPLEMLFSNLVENAIDSRLLLAAARSSGLDDDPDVQERVERFKDRVMQQAYLDREVQAQLTDEILRARYDEEIGSAPEQFEVRASHILVETEEEAAEIIGLLDEGGDFATLAEERSTGPSGPSGGDLGYFGAGPTRMVPEFEEAAFALEVDSYSEQPVQTQFGWHVILVTDRRTVEKPPFEEAVETFRAEMADQVITDALSDLREGVEIETFNMDGSPAEPAEPDAPAE